jgi:hypothetical protein
MTDNEQPEPSSDFILKRIIRNDMESVPGWRLNCEMRCEFSRMLQARAEKDKGRGR